MTAATQSFTPLLTVRDLVALTKPRINLMVLVTAAGGMWLAPGTLGAQAMWVMLITTGMVVGAANTLNCYLERDVDRLMMRTARRPLPDGRLAPKWALVLGVSLAIVSVPLLVIAVNALTGLLGLFALVSYVLIYTPMKRWTPGALFVGAVPGALPPLMGWTAVTGRIDLAGMVLFGILFFWQIPHFIAISMFRQEEYERAGLLVFPSVRGARAAKVQAALYCVVLWAVSLLVTPMGLAGWVYSATAIVGGGAFVGTALAGFSASNDKLWARRLFVVSLVYLTALFAALILDAT